MKRCSILFLVGLFVSEHLAGAISDPMENVSLDSLLQVLETEMDLRRSYEETKILRLNSIKSLKDQPNLPLDQVFTINGRLIAEYKAYSFDSTLLYVEKNIAIAEQLNDDRLIDESLLHLASLLAASGRYKESEDIMDKIDSELLSPNLKVDFHNNFRRIFADLRYYGLSEKRSIHYERLYQEHTDALKSLLPEGSIQLLAIEEKYYRDRRLIDESNRINGIRLAKAVMGTPAYSLITFERSLNCALIGRKDLEKKYLALSAISDIKASIKDNASLTNLALILYREKNIDKAHQYINFSFEDAVFFNSRLRFIEISNILSLITDAYQLKSEAQKATLKKYLAVISLLSLILLATVFYIYRQMKHLATARNELRQANEQLKSVNTDLKSTNERLTQLYKDLSESNLVKEQYIANFLNICSEFIDKLDSYRKMVRKMIMDRQYEELLNRAKSRELIDKEIALFYQTFDHTFLSIYPDFVDELNGLLQDGEQLVPKKGELLNTELRIFALIRLGISDSSKISKLLRYSVNTIYNYRVKIKNLAAVPREEFEDRIMKIDAFIQGVTEEAQANEE